jgi:hypothetical protein
MLLGRPLRGAVGACGLGDGRVRFPVGLVGAQAVEVDVAAWGETYRKLPTRMRFSFSREEGAGLPLRDRREGESLLISESRVVRTSLLS